jgi:two-component system, cell cycle sensor histidine kinase and response regulator CckA
MSSSYRDPSVTEVRGATSRSAIRNFQRDGDASYFPALFDRFPDPLVLLDENGRLIEANPAACDLMGLTMDDLRGRSIADMLETTRGDFETAWKRFRQMEKYQGQAWLLRGDGTHRLIEITAVPNFAPRLHLAAGRDVTNRYFLDDQLVQRERNGALARLSGGIAHDMTNLFNVIGGSIELIVRQITPGPELQLQIDRLLAAAEQGAALTAQLSSLGRQQILSPAVLDLTAVVQSCSRALRSVVPGNIEIILPQGGDRAAVRVDRSQMAQVIFTLASTAGELLPHGGSLTIEVNRQSLQKPLVRPGVSLPAGEYVVLRFKAQPGTAEATKPRSVGLAPRNQRKDIISGVLPRVAHALKQNDGNLWLDRSSADTVIFSIYLPSMAGQPMGIPEPGADLGGDETILIAEGDPGLRETMGEYLKAHGYRVFRASNGEEALERTRSLERVDLVITDLDLPRMGGEELARKISATQPAARVLFVCGNIDPDFLSRFPGEQKPAVLCKPFQLRALANALRDLLDSKTRTSAKGAS